MTDITMWEGGGWYGLQAVGHATGSVEACAGISGILYALVGYLRNGEREGVVHGVEVSLAPGRSCIRFAGGREAGAAFAMAEIGLRQIALACPEQVRVT